MAQNFLYMFQFIVDDLLVVRMNCCAPDEFPTCVSITFRKNVYANVCDRPYGKCVDMCQPKCWKCVLFALDSPITDEDRLLIHIYKMKDVNCKFLLGTTEMAVKDIFDKVMYNFIELNPNLSRVLEKGSRPHANDPARCFTCDYYDIIGRPEQFCPSNVLTKHILPLFNLNNLQTGNLTLIMRTVCHGPNIVSSCPYTQGSVCPNMGKDCLEENGKAGDSTLDDGNGCCVQSNPCQKTGKEVNVCKRYFGSNGCPCPHSEDEGDTAGENEKLQLDKPCKPAQAPDCSCPACQKQTEKDKEKALQKLRYLLQKYLR